MQQSAHVVTHRFCKDIFPSTLLKLIFFVCFGFLKSFLFPAAMKGWFKALITSLYRVLINAKLLTNLTPANLTAYILMQKWLVIIRGG